MIIELRKLGNNRYNIKQILKKKYANLAPSETTIYNICKRNNLNRLRKTLKEEFLEDSLFEYEEDLKNEILGFIAYYNQHRAHSSLNGITPIQFAKQCN